MIITFLISCAFFIGGCICLDKAVLNAIFYMSCTKLVLNCNSKPRMRDIKSYFIGIIFVLIGAIASLPNIVDFYPSTIAFCITAILLTIVVKIELTYEKKESFHVGNCLWRGNPFLCS